ncbi:MAG: radical SAM protein, partial [Elusimicrobia bacterium]|nr:radical SAM protein [Elusimicrobiota bacterium]
MACEKFLSEAFERYALGLARRPLASAPAGVRGLALAARAVKAGAKGWKERMTFYTRSLPAGCRPCLEGRGSNLAVTLECNRACSFCFNPRARGSYMSVHGREVGSIKEAVALLRSFGVRSVGLSGGEPLLEPARVLALARAIKRGLRGARVELYTNGSLFTRAILKRLRAAGVDGLR